MNTKQIADEARNEIRRYFNKPYYPNEYGKDRVLFIIQAAIEKAYDEGYDRGFDKGYLADESRAAHTSELPANPDKDHPERLAPARETS